MIRCWAPATASGCRKSKPCSSDDRNYLVIVGTGHLVGPGSVIDLLKKDGIGVSQR